MVIVEAIFSCEVLGVICSLYGINAVRKTYNT